MLLIFNTIIDAKARDNFTNIIADRITFGHKYEVIALPDDLPDFGKYSHLLITGSELSAAKGSKWDEKIIGVIKALLQTEKPILGICHGHQMIARAIVGDEVCRKSVEPEFGWKRMIIANNRIFENVAQPIFLESRYEEVSSLDKRFEIIATNDSPAIQAFQLKNKPVWGVQFHPEMLWQDGNKMVENHLRQHPDERQFLADEMENENLVEANLNIFRNFLNS
ncbi:MAG: gamma-glutamyl-gamma-aminobutyrate hydrolase family protein [Candidatus Cloacimonadales bacterium]|nr:gamma-glutamyl-gamma-aminobutyrate hydrolase family protein [Candidatus Cloacimonadales bacterium]